MTTTSKVLMGVLVAAVIVIGIGYAAVTDQVLNVVATASAEAAQSDFKVAFTGDGQTVDGSKGTVVATKTDDHNAVFTVTGLKLAGDSASATYTVQNNSDGINVKSLVAEVIEPAANDYFEITVTQPSPRALGEAAVSTFTVTATLIKTPLTEQTFTAGVKITATPESGTYTPEG